MDPPPPWLCLDASASALVVVFLLLLLTKELQGVVRRNAASRLDALLFCLLTKKIREKRVSFHDGSSLEATWRAEDAATPARSADLAGLAPRQGVVEGGSTVLVCRQCGHGLLHELLLCYFILFYGKI